MTQRLLALAAIGFLGGCSWMTGGSAVDAATVVYTRGASQDTMSARVPVDATRVYSAFAAVLDDMPDVEVVSRNESARMIEVTADFGEIAAQVTPLGARESLLYIWADASGTGRTGGEVATRAVEAICDELGVRYERIDY